MSLTEFQKHTIAHAYDCLTKKDNARFLVADEVGLGKTLVAREIIRKFLEDSSKSSFTVVYICNNQLLAKKNLNKLVPEVSGWRRETPPVSRLSLFPLEKFRPGKDGKESEEENICYFYALTPGTSFNITRGCGIVQERKLLYYLAGQPEDENTITFYQQDAKNGWENCNFEGIASTIKDELNQDAEYEKLLKIVSKKEDIPDKRRLLSRFGASLLNPDLVIFDEFQNYEQIFIRDGNISKDAADDEKEFRQEIDIINSVFSKLDPAPKYLLLSATPFATFTTREELARGEVDLSSCDAFCRLVDWLNSGGNFKSQWEKYAEEFKNYCEELKKQDNPDSKQILQARDNIQKLISQIMSRTERPAELLKKLVSGIDLKTSVLKAPLANSRAELFSGEGDLAEYEKYAFKPLSFMGEDYVAFKRHSNDWTKFLEKIDAAMESPYMQKLNEIMSDSEGKLRPLFWIPPSVPTLGLQGAFKNAADAGYSKVLIFSQYRFIPRMISTGLSAKFEKDYENNNSNQSYKFFKDEELNFKVKPLLSPDFEENTGIEDIFSSPAKSVYWAFKKLFQTEDDNLKQQCRLWSVLIAVALLRNMFNKMAYVNAVVSDSEKNNESKEDKAACYCFMGCFADAAYEYMYLLSQELHSSNDIERINAIGKQFYRVLQLRTNNLKLYFEGAPGETEIENHAKKMNIHFADCFSEKERSTDSSLSPGSNEGKKLETLVAIVNKVLGSNIDRESLSKLLPKESPDRNKELQSAFNSPFKPFVLSTTSIGQEGLDFHWYCRKIMHWNLPSNPVDFDQREGRINRYGSFALRQTLAAEYPQISPTGTSDAESSQSAPSFSWEKFWNDWSNYSEKENAKGLIPYWLPPESICSGQENKRCIERIVPFYPLSKEHLFIDDLLKMQAIYRMVIGHPHQDELLSLLRSLSPEAQQKIMDCTISLLPPDKSK